MRRSSLVLLASIAVPAVAQTPAKRTVEFTGLVLVNGFYNSAHVANVDVPLSADTDNIGVKSGGASIRQTRLGVLLTDPDVLGGSFTGEVDADFYGGQQPSGGGRTFPLLRLRRITATVTWPHAELLIGQDVPLVAQRNPRSLAAIGFPDFSGAGNLWLWIPQARFTVEAGYTLRLAFQAALLAPTTGTAQPAFFTQADSAERTARPELEGRVRLGWGATDDPSEIAIGGHLGWIKGMDSVSGDTILTSRALTVDTRLKIGIAEVIGEAFTGRALAGLGGGGISQNFGTQGVPVRTKGGWAQLNIRPSSQFMFGGGGGIDDPIDADVLATGRFRNLAVEGHVEWRPPGPMIFGFEFRRLQTRYAAGDFAVNHLNLAAGYAF